MRQESSLISSSFQRLRSHSSKSKSIDKLSTFAKSKANQLKNEFIKGLKEKER